jgi:hypothetical protein
MERVLCFRCEEKLAVVRVNATDLNGILLDYSALCKACARHDLEKSIGLGLGEIIQGEDVDA